MRVKVDGFRKSGMPGTTVAFGNITIDDAITVCDVRLMDGKYGLFAAMPSRMDKNGKYHELVRIKDTKLKEEVTEAMGRAYEVDGLEIPQEWR